MKINQNFSKSWPLRKTSGKSDNLDNKKTERKQSAKQEKTSEGFLPVKAHPIGEEIKHFHLDNSGEVPERIYYKVKDASEPLPYERVKELLAEIVQSVNSEGSEALKTQMAPTPETVLRLLK